MLATQCTVDKVLVFNLMTACLTRSCGLLFLPSIMREHQTTHIASLGRDQNSKLEVHFLLNVCSFCTIKVENPKSNHRKSGTVCTVVSFVRAPVISVLSALSIQLVLSPVICILFSSASSLSNYAHFVLQLQPLSLYIYLNTFQSFLSQIIPFLSSTSSSQDHLHLLIHSILTLANLRTAHLFIQLMGETIFFLYHDEKKAHTICSFKTHNFITQAYQQSHHTMFHF